MTQWKLVPVEPTEEMICAIEREWMIGYRQAIARIAVLEQENARLSAIPMKYRRMEFNAQLQNENTHLQEESDTLRRIHAENLAILNQQLALAQADNQRLRDAFQTYIDGHEECTDADDWMAMTCSMEAHHDADEAISIPSDTSALEALVQKAGEVMRERCADTVEAQHSWITNTAASALIRAQLGVTLEDLK